MIKHNVERFKFATVWGLHWHRFLFRIVFVWFSQTKRWKDKTQVNKPLSLKRMAVLPRLCMNKSHFNCIGFICDGLFFHTVDGKLTFPSFPLEFIHGLHSNGKKNLLSQQKMSKHRFLWRICLCMIFSTKRWKDKTQVNKPLFGKYSIPNQNWQSTIVKEI